MNSGGDFAWGEAFGGTGSDFARAIAVDSAGTVAVTGSFMGSVDFDFDPTAEHLVTTPRGSGYLLKLLQS